MFIENTLLLKVYVKRNCNSPKRTEIVTPEEFNEKWNNSIVPALDKFSNYMLTKFTKGISTVKFLNYARYQIHIEFMIFPSLLWSNGNDTLVALLVIDNIKDTLMSSKIKDAYEAFFDSIDDDKLMFSIYSNDFNVKDFRGMEDIKNKAEKFLKDFKK